jgi:MFS family permease
MAGRILSANALRRSVQVAEQLGANRAVLALSFGRLGDAIGNSIVFIVVPLYIGTLPAPLFPFPETVRAGIVISLFGFVNALLQPFAGALSDRVNRRKPFVLGGLLLLSVATVGFAFAKQYIDLMGLRALQGVGVALAVPATMAILANRTERETRGGSMGIFSTFRVSGLAVGPLIGGYLYEHFGYNAAFFSGAALIFLGVVLVQIWVDEVRLESSGGEERSFQIIDRELLSPAILALAFASFIMASAFTLIVPLEQDFNQRLNESAFMFGVAFSALMVARILTQIPLGRVSDHIGRKPLIIGGLILMAVSTLPMGMVNSTGELIILRVIQGIGSAGVAAPVFALAADLSKAGGEGRQFSIITMGFGFGTAVGTLGAGTFAAVWFELPFLAGGVLSFLGAWIVRHYVPETVHRAEFGTPQSAT